MRHRCLMLAMALGIWFPPTYLVTTQTQTPAKGQPAAKTAAAAKAPRMPDGHPDLRGQWDYNDATPMERPDKFAGKETLSPDEAKAAADERAAATGFSSGPRNTGYDTRIWFEQGKGPVSGRTSLIIDPPDGKMPPLTPEGQKRAAARREANARMDAELGFADGPEDRTLSERCLVSLNSGPPMKPSVYNNNVAILQTPENVAFVNEWIHVPRIVPTDGRPRPNFRGWAGQSRGHWEGDTFVVETKNYKREAAEATLFGADENLTVTERFQRLDANTLKYEFTADDPTNWTRPWTARVEMRKGPVMYEFACHEGNYSLRNILMGARAMEKAAAQKK